MFNKIALVTGSSKGIGRAIALKLAQDGYFVYVTYHTDQAGGETTLKQIQSQGGQGTLLKLDVTSEDNVVGVMDQIKSTHGHLNVLVNNAVKELSKPIETATFAEWKLAIDSKLHGTWLCTKYALPLLDHQDNANIIVVTSSADKRPSSDIWSYAVATGAVNSLIKDMAAYFPKYGIRTNAVCPSQVRTDHWGPDKDNDQLWQDFTNHNPMNKLATPKIVADAVMTLINDPHGYFNGNFLYVNGGGHLV